MFIIPDEVDLVEFFGALPETGEEWDDCWCYQVIDNKGVKIIFSCNESEKSIQVILSLGDHTLAVITSELASSIEIHKEKGEKYLTCDFKIEGAVVKADIRVQPRISLRWTALK